MEMGSRREAKSSLLIDSLSESEVPDLDLPPAGPSSSRRKKRFRRRLPDIQFGSSEGEGGKCRRLGLPFLLSSLCLAVVVLAFHVLSLRSRLAALEQRGQAADDGTSPDWIALEKRIQAVETRCAEQVEAVQPLPTPVPQDSSLQDTLTQLEARVEKDESERHSLALSLQSLNLTLVKMGNNTEHLINLTTISTQLKHDVEVVKERLKGCPEKVCSGGKAESEVTTPESAPSSIHPSATPPSLSTDTLLLTKP